MIAGRVGQLVNFSSLANDVGVSHNTIEQWISLLEASYVVFRLKPYYKNLGKRLIKSPKVYFHDTGLLCYLLGINSVKELKNHFAYGNIYENLVISEVNKQIYNQKIPLKVYFYRDSNQVEVDLVIDAGSKLYFYEIKSSQTFNSNYLKNLKVVSNLTSIDHENILIYKGSLKQPINNIKVINFEDLDIKI